MHHPASSSWALDRVLNFLAYVQPFLFPCNFSNLWVPERSKYSTLYRFLEIGIIHSIFLPRGYFFHIRPLETIQFILVYLSFIEKKRQNFCKLGMASYKYSSRTWKTKVRGWWVWGNSGLHTEFQVGLSLHGEILFQTNKQNKNKLIYMYMNIHITWNLRVEMVL